MEPTTSSTRVAASSTMPSAGVVPLTSLTADASGTTKSKPIMLQHLDSVGDTMLIMSSQEARSRLSLQSMKGGVRVELWVQPALWPGRRIGKFSGEEHQQLGLGLCTWGQDWNRIQRLHVPSRSAQEVRLYGERYLRHLKPPPKNSPSSCVPTSRPIDLGRVQTPVAAVPQQLPPSQPSQPLPSSAVPAAPQRAQLAPASVAHLQPPRQPISQPAASTIALPTPGPAKRQRLSAT